MALETLALESGYCDFLPRYLRLMRKGEWGLLPSQVLELALASKECPAYTEQVVKFLSEDLATRPDGHMSSSLCVALSMTLGPAAKGIVLEEFDRAHECSPRAQVALAVAMHFVGESEKALATLRTINGKQVRHGLLDAATALVMCDPPGHANAPALDAFGALAALVFVPEAAETDVDFERFIPVMWKSLARLGHLVFISEDKVATIGLPFQWNLRAEEVREVYERLRSDKLFDEADRARLFCDLVGALRDRTQEDQLREVLGSDYPSDVHIAAERALIQVGAGVEPTHARRIVANWRRRQATAWLRDRPRRFKELVWEALGNHRYYGIPLVAEERSLLIRAVQALGDVGSPDDLALLTTLMAQEDRAPDGGIDGFPKLCSVRSEACAAVVKIIRRHNLSGPYKRR
jgi:hypothetical protein